MRLREIYIRCKSEYEKINKACNEIKRTIELSKKQNKEDAYLYNEVLDFIKIVKNDIGDIKYLQPVIKKIEYALSKTVSIKEPELDIITSLLTETNCIIRLYESMGLQAEENIGLDIKIPKTDDITDFKKYIDDLEFIFTKCPFFQSGEASLKFDSVDVGSVWLIIGIACTSLAAGSILMNNIAAFIDSCLIIKSHKLTCKRQEQEIRRAELEQKEKEELLKNTNKLYKIAVKNVIKELEESTGYHISDGDEMGRVEQSIDRTVKLLEKGLQIYASIDSPKEVQAVFAPLEMHYLSIGEELKRIEEATEKRTE